MNEKIKQLADQANIPVIEGHWDYNDREILTKDGDDWRVALPSEIIATMYDSEKGLKRFAELIIRECAKVSEDDITDGDACCTNTADRIARQIKKHFGVK